MIKIYCCEERRGISILVVMTNYAIATVDPEGDDMSYRYDHDDWPHSGSRPGAPAAAKGAKSNKKASFICSCLFFWVGNSFAIASLAIGVKYKDDCKKQDMIPIYLIGRLNVKKSWVW